MEGNDEPKNQPRTLRAATFLDKGGVGKTTTTAHLGVALAEQGHRVLLIDLAGKQGDLVKHFGLLDDVAGEEDDWPNISTVFTEEWSTVVEKLPDAVDDMIWSTGEGVDLIPAHPGLDSRDDDLASVPLEDRYSYLERFLTNEVDPLGYDVVLLDCPGLTNNITLNALFAARNVVAPTELGEFESVQMSQLEMDIREISQETGVDVQLAMVVPNRVDTRTNLGQELLEELREAYAETVAPEHIPQSQDIRNAQKVGGTIFALDHPSTTARRALTAYEDDASALVDRLRERGEHSQPTTTTTTTNGGEHE